MPVQVPESRALVRQRVQDARAALADLIPRARTLKQNASTQEIANLADLILDVARADLEAFRVLREAQRRGIA
jgi:hypothetical protein